MKKIKEKLIKWLGGVVTNDEHNRWIACKYAHGKLIAYNDVLCEMKRKNYMPAEQRYRYIYNYVSNMKDDWQCRFEKLEKSL